MPNPDNRYCTSCYREVKPGDMGDCCEGAKKTRSYWERAITRDPDYICPGCGKPIPPDQMYQQHFCEERP